MVHKLMDAMSSALNLRGAGLTPHFHAERSSNGSCGGPPPVRSWPKQVEKSTPAAYEPTPTKYFSLSLLGVLCMAPSHVEPIPSYRFRCLSPLFCMALRRLNSRAVEAAVSASLLFSLSTSLSSHPARLETLFSFEQRSLGNILVRGAVCAVPTVHQMLSLWSLYRCGPWSSRPQPLGSGGDTTPCEDTTGRTMNCLLTLPTSAAAAGWL